MFIDVFFIRCVSISCVGFLIFYKLYNQKNPVLLPTVSDQARTDYDSVKDYFDAFLLKKPQGKIIEGKVNIGDSELRCHVGIVYALS